MNAILDTVSLTRHLRSVIVMCMHCRRTLIEGDRWEFVQEYLEKRPPNVSDGLCPECLEKHYPAKS